MNTQIETISIMEEAENRNYCCNCDSFKQTHAKTDATPAEFSCPAVDNDNDCVFYTEVMDDILKQEADCEKD